jgi:hypothetical protein
VIDVPKGGFKITCIERTPSERPGTARLLREALPDRSLLLWILKVLEWFLIALAFALSVVAATEIWRESLH